MEPSFAHQHTMPKAPRLRYSRQRLTLNPISVVKARFHEQRQHRLHRKKEQEEKQERERRRLEKAVEEDECPCINPIYLAYTPEDIAVMTDYELLNNLFDLYTPLSQPFWKEEADYLFRMMCAICQRMDELE